MSKEFQPFLKSIYQHSCQEYFEHPLFPVTPEVYKAVNQTKACRTEKLGHDVYQCPDCNKKIKVFHSCKNRFCPTCGYVDTHKWADRFIDKLIDCEHHHITFTLPASLRQLALSNKRVIHNLMMRAAGEAILDWFNCKYNIKPGVMTVLHTAGSDQKYHLHVHMLCTAGGLDTRTNTFKLIDETYYLVNQKFLAKKFRRHFQILLFKEFNKGNICCRWSSLLGFKSFIKKVNKQDWVASVKEPVANVDNIVNYIGRYIKRACISERNILDFDGENVTFRYKNYRNKDEKGLPKYETITLPVKEFLGRLFQHVPPKGFRMVRYYGIYSTATINKIPNRLRKPKQQFDRMITWQDIQIEKKGFDPLFCTCCNKEMEYGYSCINKGNYIRSFLKKTGKRNKDPGLKPNYEFCS